jgi:hypothetical protein
VIFALPGIVENVLITPKKMFTITRSSAGLKKADNITLELKN